MATLSKRCEHKGTKDESRCGHPWWMHFERTNKATGLRERHRHSIDVLNDGIHVAGKKDAEGIMAATIAAIHAGTFSTFGATDTKALLYRDVIERYKAAYIVAKGIKGQATQYSMLDRAARAFGDRVFGDVKTIDYESYIADLQQPEAFRKDQKKARTRTRATVNRHITRLRHMDGWAVERDLLDQSRFVSKAGKKPLIRLLKGEAQRDRRIPLKEENAIRMACRADAEFQDWFTIALDSGMRAGEIFGLQVSDVSLTSLTITVQAHKTKTSKKRVIPIAADSRLYDVLFRRLRHSDGSARQGDALVFVDFDGHAIKISTFRDRLYAACKRAKVQRPRVHDIRHEAASRWYYEAGVRLQVVQRWLGHATLDMTSRYLNVRDEGMADEAAKLGRYLAKNDTLTTRAVLATRAGQEQTAG